MAKMSAGARLLYILTRPLAALPLGFHRAAGRWLGKFMGRRIAYRRDTVIANLSRSFPDRKYDELSAIADKFYVRLATIFTEAIWFGGCDADRLMKSGIVRMANPELLNTYAAEGRSVCVMSAHAGNWELLGGWMLYNPDGYFQFTEKDVAVVYKKQSSDSWDEFFARNRKAPLDDLEGYEGLIESKSIMRYAVTHRNDFKIYNFITDQYPYSPRGVMEDLKFMNQNSRAMTGAAALAHSFGMAAVYLNMRVEDDGNYTMEFTEISHDASQTDTDTIVREFFRLLEQDLQKQPFNYLWTHRRWK